MITKLSEYKLQFEAKKEPNAKLADDILLIKQDTLEELDPKDWEIEQIVDVLTDLKTIKKIEENSGSNVSMDLTVKDVKIGQKIYLTALLKPKNKSTAFQIGEMGVIAARVTDVFYGLNKLNQLQKAGKLLR